MKNRIIALVVFTLLTTLSASVSAMDRAGPESSALAVTLEVYPAGAGPYVGWLGLQRAIDDLKLLGGGEIIVHQGFYTGLNSLFIGVAGTNLPYTVPIKIRGAANEARPVIVNANPSILPTGNAGLNGVLRIYAPHQAVSLENLEFRSETQLKNFNALSVAAVIDFASASFVMSGCKIETRGTTQLADGYLAGLGVGLAFNKFSRSTPGLPTGEIRILNTEIAPRAASLLVGWLGQVEHLSLLEISGCVFVSKGGPTIEQFTLARQDYRSQVASTNGTMGVIISNYFAAAVEGLPTLQAMDIFEGTTPDTRMIIKNNLIQAGFPLQLLGIGGTAEISGNTFRAAGRFTYAGTDLYGGLEVSSHSLTPHPLTPQAVIGDYSASAMTLANNRITLAGSAAALPGLAAVTLGHNFWRVFSNGALPRALLLDLRKAQFLNNVIESAPGARLPGGGFVSAGAQHNISDALAVAVEGCVFAGNNLTGLTAAYAQMELGKKTSRNLITGNLFGALDDRQSPTAARMVGVLLLAGRSNQIVGNDYRQAKVNGWEWADSAHTELLSVGCLFLTSDSQDNQVFEAGMFPAGAGGARHNVLNAGVNNRVVGLSASDLADPGIAQLAHLRYAVIWGERTTAVVSGALIEEQTFCEINPE